MSNEKRIIYRREPIKKYKMHKVKKHWVVKSGVAGAMIVGSVGAPMVPHLAFAAETEEVDSGEETEVKSLADVQEESMQTVESTVPEVPVETVATATEETVEEVEETKENTSEDGKLNDSTEQPEAPDTSEIANNSPMQRGLVQADDSSGYDYTAGENASDPVVFDKSSFKRILRNGDTAPSSYTSPYYDSGLFFKITVNGSDNKFKKGEKVFIPLSYETKIIPDGTMNIDLPSVSVSGLGQVKYVIGDSSKANSAKNGYVLTFDQDFNETKIFSLSISGRSATDTSPPGFHFFYDSASKKIETFDIDVKFENQQIGQITSSYKESAFKDFSESFGRTSNTASSISALLGYSNTSGPQNVISGETNSFPKSFVQVDKVTVDNLDGLISYTGSEGEDIYDYTTMYTPTPEGNGYFSLGGSLNLAVGNQVAVGAKPYKYVQANSSINENNVTEFLKNNGQGSKRYTVFRKNGTNTFIIARYTDVNDTLLTQTIQYQQSGAKTPVEYFEKTTGLKYTNPSVIAKINTAFSTKSIGSKIWFDLNFADDTVARNYTLNYSDELGVSENYEASSVPNKIGIEGQTLVKVSYVDENGNAIKAVMNKVGWPGATATVTAADLAIKGYTLDKTKLPAGANSSTGEISTVFPEEGKTTELKYVYKVNNSTVKAKYQLDKNGDGVGDEAINAGADDTTLTGKFGQMYITQAKDYRSKNYFLTKQPSNARARYDEPTPDVLYVYQATGSLIIDKSVLKENNTTTRYVINDDLMSVKDLLVPTPPTGYHYVNEAGQKLTPGQAIQPANKTKDTKWKLVGNDAKVIYHYVDSKGAKVANDIEIAAKVKDTIVDKKNVITGWLYEKNHANSDSDMLVDEDGLSEVTYVYKPMGKFVPESTDASFPKWTSIQYPNHATDPAKTLDPSDAKFPVIPYVPNYTPKDSAGKALTLINASDPSKGYKAPTISNPGTDTPIKYELNSGRVIYHYVDSKGTKIANDIEIAAKVKDPIADKKNVISGWLFVETHASSDSDMIVDLDGLSEMTYVYRPMGKFVPESTDTSFPKWTSIQYPNHATDPAKTLDPSDSKFPVIPYVAGYTPKDSAGKALTLVNTSDPTKGYKAPTISNPGTDTPIKYELNSGKVIYHYVDKDGKKVAADVEVAAKVKDKIADKKIVIEGYLFSEIGEGSDPDGIVDLDGLSEMTYVY